MFCFPKAAIRYQQAYATEFGTNTRTAFAFAARTPCSAEQVKTVRDAAARIGLRRYSLPGEYGALPTAP